METQEKNVGDVWLVRLPGRVSLEKMLIEKKTEKTVLLTGDLNALKKKYVLSLNPQSSFFYKISDLEWVEKVTKDEQ